MKIITYTLTMAMAMVGLFGLRTLKADDDGSMSKKETHHYHHHEPQKHEHHHYHHGAGAQTPS